MMFAGIRDDFDAAYWTRGSIAVLVAASAGASAGTAWIVYALISRILYFLIQWLLAFLVPPAVATALIQNPVVYELEQRIETAAIEREVALVELDEELEATEPSDDLDRFEPPPPPPLPGERDEPEPPAEEPWIALSEFEEERPVAMLLGALGTYDDGEAGLLGVLVSDDAGVFDVLTTTGPGDEGAELAVGGWGVVGKGTADEEVPDEVPEAVVAEERAVVTDLIRISLTNRIETEARSRRQDEGIEGGVPGGVVGGVLGVEGGVEGGVPGGVVGGVVASRAPVRIVDRARPKVTSAMKSHLADVGFVECRVEVTVGPDARITQTNIDDGCPSAFRDAVRKAVDHSRFEAAVRGGQSVSGTTWMVFDFEE